MTALSGTVPRSRPARRTASRIGLTLAAVMSVANMVNGAGSLIDPTFGQLDPSVPPQPAWMSVGLLAFGLATLVFLVPAWRGVRRALWAIVVTRLLEAWSATVLPFLPGAPDGIWLMVGVLILAGTVVAGLVATGLRR